MRSFSFPPLHPSSPFVPPFETGFHSVAQATLKLIISSGCPQTLDDPLAPVSQVLGLQTGDTIIISVMLFGQIVYYRQILPPAGWVFLLFRIKPSIK